MSAPVLNFDLYLRHMGIHANVERFFNGCYLAKIRYPDILIVLNWAIQPDGFIDENLVSEE